MGTTADKLEYLDGTKTAIKNAIVAKGVAVPDGTTFRAYADKISSIQDVSSLPTQGAKTVTPTTSEQIAVASGRYTTGDVKVSGDANLVPENIAEGVSIFGVTGTHSGGGGGVQTVTGTFACGIKGGATFSYTDGDGVYQEVSRVIGPISVSVVKNSLVLVDASFRLGMLTVSGATLQALDGDDRFKVYRIDQDGFSFS